MPKQVFTLNDFSGGLNTDKSLRALEDNELAECTNFDVSSKGKIVASRIFEAPTGSSDLYGEGNSTGAETDPGYGLFTFSNDNLISIDTTTNVGEFIVFTGDAAELDLFVGGTTNATPPVLSTPASLVFHKQTRVPSASADGGYDGAINIWKAGTQAKPIPATTEMEIVESDGTGTAYNSATGKGQNDLIWIIKPLDGDGDTTDTSGLWTNDHDGTEYYEYAASWLYKNEAESDLVMIQNHSDDGTSFLFASDDPTEAGMRNASSFTDKSIQIQCWINHANPTTEAVSYLRYGARLYSRLASEEGDWYLLAEMNFEKGIKGDGETEWNSWVAATSSAPNFDHGTTGDQCTTGIISAPPALLTYKILNGHSTGDIPDSDQTGVKDRLVKWKTGLIANSRAYIGNVEVNGRSYGDRILKSPIFQYDVFTEDSYLDVAINDGDQITALAAHGDRILQFKNSAVYIINVSKELEFLEDEQQGAGVAFQAAVVTTPFGVVWVNTNGCYLYDGDKITQLQIGKISTTEWENVTSLATIGYDPLTQQVIVLWSANNGTNAFVFDAETGGWHKVTDMVDGTKNTTNMVNARGDKLLIGGAADINYVNFLADRTAAAGSFSLKSKVLDFGNPESKKNLLEVAVTYNGRGHASLDFDIITDDGTSTKVDALDNIGGSDVTEEFDESGTAALRGQKTYQIHINGTCDHRFELYSISLTYRDLGVH